MNNQLSPGALAAANHCYKSEVAVLDPGDQFRTLETKLRRYEQALHEISDEALNVNRIPAKRIMVIRLIINAAFKDQP